jgi:sialate O-acetylesterase
MNMKSIANLSSLIISITIVGGSIQAEVKLPAIISDHMVLQADAEVPIWGTASPGESIAVSFGAATASTTAGADGRWEVRLPKLKAGQSESLVVRGSNTVTVNDVLVGEVWLGSGQSNMAMTVNRTLDFEKQAAAANFPQIRMFTVTSRAATSAQSDCTGEWTICSPQTVPSFSATAYFFGRELHRELGVPVGLINSSVGGTPIESWISPEAQAASPELKAFFASEVKADGEFDAAKAKAKYERDLATWEETAKKAKAARKAVPKKPQDPLVTRERKGNVGGLFNGKISPLVKYRIRGALWYQGEANTTPAKAEFYQYQLPLLIKDWRARWGYDFPVAWVQLPNFGGPGRDWPTVREAMLKTLSVPNTGMAITIDIGEEKDIHPKNKEDVGKRLALWALGEVYGKSGPTSGPLPASHERRADSIAVRFKHAQGGLVSKGGELRGFEIADKEGKWSSATARIDGETVVVSSSAVKSPTAARYAWSNFPDCNLFNAAGLPASPFRTDMAK